MSNILQLRLREAATRAAKLHVQRPRSPSSQAHVDFEPHGAQRRRKTERGIERRGKREREREGGCVAPRSGELGLPAPHTPSQAKRERERARQRAPAEGKYKKLLDVASMAWLQLLCSVYVRESVCVWVDYIVYLSHQCVVSAHAVVEQ